MFPIMGQEGGGRRDACMDDGRIVQKDDAELALERLSSENPRTHEQSGLGGRE
jgi:hypothetical protein